MKGHAERAGEPVDRGRVALALRRGRAWILLGAVAGISAALALTTWVVPARYVARAAVVWEQAVPAQSESEAARQLRTMVDGIVLPENLIEIREQQRLEVDLKEIAARLSIDYDRDSNLVTIDATARDPRQAASLANVTARVFVEHRRLFEAERRAELVHALDNDLGRARSELAAARSEYDAFRQANRIADLPAETQRAIETAATLRVQANLAQADLVSEQSRERAARAQPRRIAAPSAAVVATPQTSPEQLAIEGRLAQARLELVEARSRYSSAHPDVQRLVSAVAALRARRIAPAPASPTAVASPRPIRRPAGAASSGRTEAAEERQNAYAKLAADAQRHLLELSQQQGAAARLLAAQGFAEQHLAELTALRAPVMDEARSPVAGLRVFSTAVPPEQPESSAAATILLVGMPPLFALLTAMWLVLWQVAARKVHTAREVAFWGKGTTVASTHWPRGAETIESLFVEIADEAAHAEGRTLVVATMPRDAFLARGLAAHLTAATTPDPEPDGHPGEVVLVPPAPTRRGSIQRALPGSTAVPTEASATGGFRDALALRPAPAQEVRVRTVWRGTKPTFAAWNGPLSGASLRRLSRLADRVLVLVRSGSTSIRQLATVRASVGREEGVGFVILDLDERLHDLPDRAGSVDDFWRGRRE